MKEIKGILCALLTPLNEDESIDLDAAERLTEFVAAGGTNGILALGSTGESIALDREARNSFRQKSQGIYPGRNAAACWLRCHINKAGYP